MSDKYGPASINRHMHRCPHIEINNHRLHTVSNDWGVSDGHYWGPYTESLITLPVIIGCIGTLALLIFGFALCFRCCGWCTCAPFVIIGKDGQQYITRQALTNKVIVGSCMCVFILFVLIVDQTVIFGDRGLNQAVHVLDMDIDFLSNQFGILNTNGVQLEANGQYLLNNATLAVNSGCTAAATTIDDINNFNDNVASYQSFVEPLPGYTSNAKHEVHKYGVRDRKISLWVLYAVSMLAAVIFIISMATESKALSVFNVSYSWIVVEALIIFCCLAMILLVSDIMI
jgi:hypothetical protein